MSELFKTSRLSEVGHNVKLIAVRIREDLKTAIKAGLLPQGIKVSVTSDYNSINMRVTRWPGPSSELLNPACFALVLLKEFSQRVDRHTKRGQEVLDLLRLISGQYNYDRSDLQSDYFDVNFYFHADISIDAPEIDPELLRDMEIMRAEDHAFYRRQLESLNTGRPWFFGM